MINVSPRVLPQPGGSYLVADAMEQQLRVYASNGHLVHTFGRRGSGPGEFQHISAIARLHDGTILVADMGGQLTRFDSTGTRVLRTVLSGLGPVYEMLVLDDSMVAIIGRKGGRSETPLVHEWNLVRERVSRAYFSAPQGPKGFAGAYAFTGFANGAVRGDTLAVVFALQDTLHLFLRGGREIGKMPLPFRGFRRLSDPLSPEGSPEQFQSWLESFSATTDLYWLPDGSFLVQYLDQKRSDRVWSLLHMRRDGGPLWETAGSPKLLATAADGSLVFVRPGAEAPNVWSIGRVAAR